MNKQADLSQIVRDAWSNPQIKYPLLGAGLGGAATGLTSYMTRDEDDENRGSGALQDALMGAGLGGLAGLGAGTMSKAWNSNAPTPTTQTPEQAPGDTSGYDSGAVQDTMDALPAQDQAALGKAPAPEYSFLTKAPGGAAKSVSEDPTGLFAVTRIKNFLANANWHWGTKNHPSGVKRFGEHMDAWKPPGAGAGADGKALPWDPEAGATDVRYRNEQPVHNTPPTKAMEGIQYLKNQGSLGSDPLGWARGKVYQHLPGWAARTVMDPLPATVQDRFNLTQNYTQKPVGTPNYSAAAELQRGLDASMPSMPAAQRAAIVRRALAEGSSRMGLRHGWNRTAGAGRNILLQWLAAKALDAKALGRPLDTAAKALADVDYGALYNKATGWYK